VLLVARGAPSTSRGHYELVRLARLGSYLLTLTFDRGVEAYAFTFG
jgi:hypothetical protein